MKNVGTQVIQTIVNERDENGLFENFTSFCERIKDKGVNKKCIESLIKAGVFDCFENTRATLLASYEGIIDTINNSNRKVMENQVSMFDIMEEETIETKKYVFNIMPEMEEKELLSEEREMLGIYISGHPLEKYREILEKKTNINTLNLIKINEDMEEFGRTIEYKDNQNVKYAGIITKIKKKFTKNNTVMAFLTVEDLYGTVEIIVFDRAYHLSQNILLEENVVVVEGKLSIREDEPVKIVASEIKDINENNSEEIENKPSKINTVSFNITNLSEEIKDKLRGAIKFFMGDRANVRLEIVQNEDEVKPCGTIYMTDEILKQFKEIIGEENVVLK